VCLKTNEWEFTHDVSRSWEQSDALSQVMTTTTKPTVRKILVTGATGFTGREVVPRLLQRYGEITCFVRASSKRSQIDLPGVKFAEGDIDDCVSLEAAMQGKDTLVNVAFLVRHGEPEARRAKGIVRSCHAAGIRRAIFISSTSIFTTLKAADKIAKLASESAVVNSGLDYTILRPTMIYGTEGDRNIIRLVRFLRQYPVVFVPGDGTFRQQPVHVEDLAQAIVDCLDVKTTIGKAYNLSGAHSVTFNEVIDQTCQVLDVKRLKVHLPLGPALWLARLSQHIQGKPLIKEEQLLRLNEDKSIDHCDARRDFGFSPRSFLEGIRQEVAQL